MTNKFYELSIEIIQIKKQKNIIINDIIYLLKSNGCKHKYSELKLKLKKINYILNKKLKQKEKLLKIILYNLSF